LVGGHAATGRLVDDGDCLALELDPEKWKPVFGKDHAPTIILDHDPILFDRVMV
jgi:hypothetical protein